MIFFQTKHVWQTVHPNLGRKVQGNLLSCLGTAKNIIIPPDRHLGALGHRLTVHRSGTFCLLMIFSKVLFIVFHCCWAFFYGLGGRLHCNANIDTAHFNLRWKDNDDIIICAKFIWTFAHKAQGRTIFFSNYSFSAPDRSIDGFPTRTVWNNWCIIRKSSLCVLILLDILSFISISQHEISQ